MGARIGALEHDSDRGESAAYALVGEPVWTGRADALQLRSDVSVEGLRVHFVSAAVVAGAAAGAVDRGGGRGRTTRRSGG